MIHLFGKARDIVNLFRKAIDEGYGNLPTFWSLKLYLERN